MGPIGWPELVIILVVVVLVFGTTRLAGLGKAAGKSVREFREETKSLKTESQAEQAPSGESSAPVVDTAPAEPAPAPDLESESDRPE